MSPRLRPITRLLCVFAMSASTAFAQSEWKEIPVGYNMPKSVVALAPLSTMAMAAAAPTPPTATRKRYYGRGRDPYHKWEAEFHGGGFFTLGSAPPGQGYLLPAGTPIAATLPFVTPTVQVSSFIFGDGANLANQIGGAGSIVPLDPLLAGSLGTRDSGPSLGFRLSRDFGKWFNGEMNFDWSWTPVAIGDSRLLQIEATRASFGNFFPVSTPEGAISDVKRSAGSQLFYTGVVNVNLKPAGKVIPYLSFGGGAVTDIGPKP